MINLLYCGNDRVFDGILISLMSIIKYTNQPVSAFILTMNLTDLNENNKRFTPEHERYLNDLIQKKNSESKVIVIDITEIFRKDMENSPNLMNSYTPYTLARLYADQLPQLPDRILYLDTDTIANEDISPVFNYKIDDYEFAGVIDYLGKIFIKYNYMNAGVLYLNLEQIRNRGTFEKARHMCKNKKMWFPDQDALNKVVEKKLFLPVKYNEQRKLRKDTVIQHFCKSIRFLPYFHTVNYKPWNVEEIRTIYKIHAYDDVLDEYLRIKKEVL